MRSSKICWVGCLVLTILFSGCKPAAAEVPQTETTVEPVASSTIMSTETSLPQETKPASATATLEIPMEIESQTPSPVTDWPVRDPFLTAGVKGGELLFTLVKRANENYQNLGVYRVNLTEGSTSQIFAEDFQLQAVSPDGNWLLVNQGLNLYVSRRDGVDPILISNAFSEQSLVPALWSWDGESVLWMELAGDQKKVRLANTKTGEITDAAGVFQDQPAAILNSGSDRGLSWLKGTCNSGNYCRGELLMSTPDGSTSISWGEVINPVPDASQTQVAFLEQGETDVLLRIRVGGESVEPITLDMDEDIPVDYDWSPDGQALMVLGQIRSDYSGKNFGNHVIVYRAPEWKPEILAELEGLNARLTFAADGQSVVISSTKVLETGDYAVEVSILSLTDKTMRIVGLGVETQMEDYVFIPRIWD